MTQRSRPTTSIKSIDIHNVIPGETGAGGWDCCVQIELSDGETVEGELTLLQDGYSGRPAAWGGIDHWCSSEIVRYAYTLSEEERTSMLDAIESAACDAIQSADVEQGRKA